MKPTLGKLNLEDVRRLSNEGLGVLEIARRLRRRNDLIVAALRGLGIRQWPDKPWLEEHYVALGESIDEMALHWHLKESTIRFHLRKHGIPIRYKSRGKIRNGLLADIDWLQAKYIDENLPWQAIADLAGCSTSALQWALVRHKFPRRNQSIPRKRYTGNRLPFLGNLRRGILARDGYQCRWPDCGSIERLEINHIVPLRQGGETVRENGITLCREHHKGISGRESDYISLFSELIQLGSFT